MSRGWESKDVESQQQEREARIVPKPAAISPEETERRARVQHLQLQRTRVLGELQSACNARFRGQLEASLAFLDTELSKLESA